MLWKERRPEPMGVLDRLGMLAMWLVLALLIGRLTWYFASDAFRELAAHGYGSAGPDGGRAMFNTFLRTCSAVFGLLVAIVTAGLGAEGVVRERAGETWTSLIATPLSGREILRAKRSGAAWRVRGVSFCLIALWTLGALAGAVHPLGLAAATLALVVSVRFFASLGTYVSLISDDAAQASNRALLPALALVLSGLIPVFLSQSPGSWLLASGSPSWLLTMSLVTYRQMANDWGSSHASASAASYVIGLATLAALTYGLDRRGEGRFDAIVGRPRRPVEAAEAPRLRVATAAAP